MSDPGIVARQTEDRKVDRFLSIPIAVEMVFVQGPQTASLLLQIGSRTADLRNKTRGVEWLFQRVPLTILSFEIVDRK